MVGIGGQRDPDPAPIVLAVEGLSATVALLMPAAHSDNWAEAWQVRAHEPNIGQPRWYLVRIDHDDRYGIGYAVIDDQVVADARSAGLPEAIGIMARMVAILPGFVDTDDQARWVMKQLARYIAREAPDPPHYDSDLSAWRAILGVLIECLHDKAVRESLT